jgi:hypothetical protein
MKVVVVGISVAIAVTKLMKDDYIRVRFSIRKYLSKQSLTPKNKFSSF